MRDILAVDDNHFAQVAYVYALKGSSDYAVTTASSGAEAVELARKHRFDLVFLDLKMPDMDGVETLRLLRAMWPDIPIYIVTAYRDEYLLRLQEAVQAGLSFQVAEKPLDGEKIVAIVRGVLDGPLRMNA